MITSLHSGNRTDTLWLHLDGQPGVEPASARSLDLPLFETVASRPTCRVFSATCRGSRMQQICVLPGTPLLYVSPETVFVSPEKVYVRGGLPATLPPGRP